MKIFKNFINYEDNNIFAASKAFANQKQFWKDFKNLMNSDFLIDRRRGVRFSLNENDIANAAQRNGVRGVIAKALEIGFMYFLSIFDINSFALPTA